MKDLQNKSQRLCVALMTISPFPLDYLRVFIKVGTAQISCQHDCVLTTNFFPLRPWS